MEAGHTPRLDPFHSDVSLAARLQVSNPATPTLIIRATVPAPRALTFLGDGSRLFRSADGVIIRLWSLIRWSETPLRSSGCGQQTTSPTGTNTTFIFVHIPYTQTPLQTISFVVVPILPLGVSVAARVHPVSGTLTTVGHGLEQLTDHSDLEPLANVPCFMLRFSALRLLCPCCVAFRSWSMCSTWLPRCM